jgi:hypothetical protein
MRPINCQQAGARQNRQIRRSDERELCTKTQWRVSMAGSVDTRQVKKDRSRSFLMLYYHKTVIITRLVINIPPPYSQADRKENL